MVPHSLREQMYPKMTWISLVNRPLKNLIIQLREIKILMWDNRRHKIWISMQKKDKITNTVNVTFHSLFFLFYFYVRFYDHFKMESFTYWHLGEEINVTAR
jgi:hypothetical protein